MTGVKVRDLGKWREWAQEWRGIIVFLVVAALLAAGLWQSARRAGEQAEELRKIARETHGVLCTYKGDLERRLEDTIRYLDNHPGKEPVPGITRADLRRSVQNQRATLDALEALNCGR